MKTNYATIRVVDRGKFHNRFVQFSATPLEDNVFIKYPDETTALPVTAIYNSGLINISAAMIGKLGDIKIPVKQWLRILVLLNKKELTEKWKEVVGITTLAES